MQEWRPTGPAWAQTAPRPRTRVFYQRSQHFQGGGGGSSWTLSRLESLLPRGEPGGFTEKDRSVYGEGGDLDSSPSWATREIWETGQVGSHSDHSFPSRL